MHELHMREFPTKTSKQRMFNICSKHAEQEGDYHSPLDGMRFTDTVLANREEAERWIEAHDRGWYDNLAIRFKDGRKIMWLVKYEFHV